MHRKWFIDIRWILQMLPVLSSWVVTIFSFCLDLYKLILEWGFPICIRIHWKSVIIFVYTNVPACEGESPSNTETENAKHLLATRAWAASPRLKLASSDRKTQVPHRPILVSLEGGVAATSSFQGCIGKYSGDSIQCWWHGQCKQWWLCLAMVR